MKIIAILVFLCIGVLSSVSAIPEDFVRDIKEFRHGTNDRFSRPKTVYIDADGSIYVPAINNLVLVDREFLNKIIEAYGKNRENLEIRVYIHPEANWSKLHELVDWLDKQKIGKLDLKLAELNDKTKPASVQQEHAEQDAAPNP